MPRNRFVAKVLDFLFRDADPPHGLGHLADDAEVIAGTIKSHKRLGIFGVHRERPCADMSARSGPAPASVSALFAAEAPQVCPRNHPI
jgi:hypothetical protein